MSLDIKGIKFHEFRKLVSRKKKKEKKPHIPQTPLK